MEGPSLWCRRRGVRQGRRRLGSVGLELVGRSVESALGVSLTCQPRLEVVSVSETNRFDGRRGGGGWRAAFFRAAAPKRNACRGVEDGELDSGREINSGFVLEVPPSDMMPSHCRCEGPGLGLGHGGEGGRRRKRKPQVQGSAQGSAGQRNAPPHLHLAWIWAPRLGTGVCWRRTRLAR